MIPSRLQPCCDPKMNCPRVGGKLVTFGVIATWLSRHSAGTLRRRVKVADWRKEYSDKAPPCIHCGQDAEFTTGAEVYSHKRLADKAIWICRPCKAYCGCHKGTHVALGYPANKELRGARMILHQRRLDPLWKPAKGFDRTPYKREEVYRYLSQVMAIPRKQTHVAMFTLEQCREAWLALGSLYEQRGCWNRHG